MDEGGKIKVPFVNVYVNHNHGFKGQIEIELLPEFNSFLNSETINTQLTSQLKYLNRNYVVKYGQEQTVIQFNMCNN